MLQRRYNGVAFVFTVFFYFFFFPPRYPEDCCHSWTNTKTRISTLAADWLRRVFTQRALQKKRKKKSSLSHFSSSRLIYTSLLYTGPPFLMRNTGTADLRRPAPYDQHHFEPHMDEFKHKPPWLAFTESQDIYLYSPLRICRPVQRNGFHRCAPTPLPVPSPHI